MPKTERSRFPEAGSGLARYAGLFDAVEINSSFYKPHRPSTYVRWAESVPDGFGFAVKLPREITHERRLVDVAAPLERFLGEVGALGDRLGPILVQLPPSLAFQPEVALAFLDDLRGRVSGDIVIEPRHASWLTHEADGALVARRIARAMADPAPVPGAGEPGGWSGLVYLRLHGSPRIYYSAYTATFLDGIAQRLAACAREGRNVWCILDNTALGAATTDALSLKAKLGNG